MTATVYYRDQSKKDITDEVVWSSEDEEIATVEKWLHYGTYKRNSEAQGEVPWKKHDDLGESHEINKNSALGITGGFLYVFKHVHSLHTMIKCSYIQDNAA
ncbi:hypothetical protein [Brevibacillus formosus]|uniref:hypothetical protein n=1 Tax=Brevibacillus formosus TaxID=54913 RepID=UPI003594295B